MQIPKNGILFFDSGIGGLTLLRDCVDRIQGETFYYYGDNLNAPYGNLPTEKIQTYLLNAFETYAFLNPKAAVLACNTATTTCMDLLKTKYTFPILGIEPAIYSAASALKNKGGVLLVLATCATCASERVRIIMEKANKAFPRVKILIRPCAELAGVIEKNVSDVSFDYTLFLPPLCADGVVLGCTHYSFIKRQISAFYGAPVFDGNQAVIDCLQATLHSQSGGAERGRAEVVEGAQMEAVGRAQGKNEKNPFKRWNPQPLVTPSQNLSNFPQIYFLGESKSYNANIFEQMFVNIRK